MKTEDIDWEKETELYFFVADRFIKFGISSNWERREKTYRRTELKDIEFLKVKTVIFEKRWQAELIEQVMKWRLRRWAVPGRHEWIENLTLQNVVDCYHEIRKELFPEFYRYEYIHRHGSDRWDFYKQIASYYFK
jgi:hypothetical protein